MKNLIFACLFLLSLFLSSCTVDQIGDLSDPGGGTSNMSIPTAPDDRFRVTFDMIKKKYTAPVNPSDVALLSLTDKIMLTPVFEGYHVELAITGDGAMVANIDKVNLPEIPSYPHDAVYPYPEDAKDLSRIEIRDDVVHCYNQEGELIGSGVTFVPPSLSSMMNGIRTSASLPADQIDIAVQAFNDAGVSLSPTEMEGVYLHVLTLDDGGIVKTLFDFNLGVELGQAGFRSDGSLEYKTNVNVDWDESQHQLVLAGHRFVTRAVSPSSNVEMEIIERSDINNYQFELINE